jgi:hypothetical protein
MSLRSGGKEITEMNKMEDDEYGEILNQIIYFRNILSQGLRNSIVKNRVRIEERVYTGFDTEYSNKEYGKNELLCVTTSTFTRSFLVFVVLRQVSDLDFKITGNYSDASNLPLFLSNSILLQILAIREIGGRADSAIDTLIQSLKNKGSSYGLSVYEQRDKVLVTIKKDINVNYFVNTYNDFETSSDYSLQ